jgi:hypothetical protein
MGKVLELSAETSQQLADLAKQQQGRSYSTGIEGTRSKWVRNERQDERRFAISPNHLLFHRKDIIRSSNHGSGDDPLGYDNPLGQQ